MTTSNAADNETTPTLMLIKVKLPAAAVNLAAGVATFPPYITPDGIGTEPNTDGTVVDVPQLDTAFRLVNESQFIAGFGTTAGTLNALSSSASAEYLSAETGGAGALTDPGPPTVFTAPAPAGSDTGPPTVFTAPAPAGSDTGPPTLSLANASKLANPADVSATHNN